MKNYLCLLCFYMNHVLFYMLFILMLVLFYIWCTVIGHTPAVLVDKDDFSINFNSEVYGNCQE